MMKENTQVNDLVNHKEEVNRICNSLDRKIGKGGSDIELLFSSKISSKIKRGIIDLEKLNEPLLADHYKSEYKTIAKKRILVIVAGIIIFSAALGGLYFLGFESEM